MTRNSSAFSVAFAALFAVGAAHAASSAADRAFVAKAAPDGAAEVALGRLAAAKASSSQVKEFASKMVDDHSRAGAELKQIAEAQGIKAPDSPNAAQLAAQRRLEKLAGDKFDRAYAKLMRDDHDKAVRLFAMEAKGGGNPALKEFAAKTLPTLEEHRKMAHALPVK